MPFDTKNLIEGGFLFSKKGFTTQLLERERVKQNDDKGVESLNEEMFSFFGFKAGVISIPEN